MRQNLIALVIALFVTAVFFFIYMDLQPTVDYQQAPLFDGNQYLKIYRHFKNPDSNYQVSYPYHSRLLVPWLASLLPFEKPIPAFHAINLVFSLLSITALFLLWRALKINKLLLFVGFFWLIFHWTGMIRLNLFDPVTVDVALYFFQTLLLVIIWYGRYEALLLLGPLATAQKESFIALLIMLTAISLYRKLRYKMDAPELKWIAGALLLSLITKLLINQLFPPLEVERNVFVVILFHLKEVALDPVRLLRWAVGIFVAFGGPLLLFFLNASKNKWQDWFELKLLLFSLLYLFFGIGAGGDILRILFLGFPFIMTLILIRLNQVNGQLIIISMIVSIPLFKFRAVIPDPVREWKVFVEWYPEYASLQMVLAWLVFGLLCLMVLFFSNRYYSKKKI
ncbi:MAG: hypothetical protein O6848_00795 [Bacteroidetes bacterium]|nr:hypothetical protein [Bacteroidota bacterium]